MTIGKNITGPFDSVLIANRGEIAVRVAHTLRRMGIRSVAIHSDADRDALHVRAADMAVGIGGLTARESYLDIGKVIEAARRSRARAIHPGYGFLSENADFAQACRDAGLIFIGPSPDTIRLMGDKAAAKRHMRASGVPCLPGYDGEDQSVPRLIAEGRTIGFPLMVKAAAGGGGRGMRIAPDAAALPGAIQAARDEALSTFGSGDLILERAVQNPRHVEVQVMADAHGNAIHLGERDCSVQRRHQKVIEEAPCPVLTPDQRAHIGRISAEAARSIGYLGAGTMEFLLDDAGDLFFLEMNTRLQVEHPVTEMVTGLDLVGMQIRVARGQTLGMTQDDLRMDGHAIEIRLYAEDPSRDFAPGIGRLAEWHRPSGEVRIDAGLDRGQEITPYYDSMIAKLIAHGQTRSEALDKLVMALRENAVFGFATNQAFLLDLLTAPDFVAGRATTSFIGQRFGEAGFPTPQPSPDDWALAAVMLFCAGAERMFSRSRYCSAELRGWSSATPLPKRMVLVNGSTTLPLSVTPDAGGWQVRGGNRHCHVRLEGQGRWQVDGRAVRLLAHLRDDAAVTLFVDGVTHEFRLQTPGAAGQGAGSGTVFAPMHGQLIECFVRPGDRVSAGDRLFLLEAMKMQHAILADCDGTVEDLPVTAPAQVAEGDLICRIAETEE
ncbi:acetyl/propionyl/methylcrotonyl-CoA carboxylase subunit alpha [Paracoccus sp. (in: a-proteobacteria)]|uniref:acetyl/propionyl/methylcrotonyl-CoA carboxylase subunit alpha n=1 Tax=Paracoccus sp. TaxID=267 RepID=UPI003A86AF0D